MFGEIFSIGSNVGLPHEDRSFPHLKYPSLRDGSFPKDGFNWIQGKILDDGAEGFWRIHDKLYDFTSFIDKHPGGSDWLDLTKGTDITEAFETHHLSLNPEKMLTLYYIRDASTARNSPFTFKENGFYRTLKSRVRDELKYIKQTQDNKSKRLIEGLSVAILIFSLIACTQNYKILKISAIFLAALFLAWTTICAHNFLHLKDNWRMYLFNLSGLDYREMRISHALSHHLYPNTIMDFEITAIEPFIYWLPSKKKTLFYRFAPWIYGTIIYFFVFDFECISRIYRILHKDISLRKTHFLAFLLPTLMYALSNAPILDVLINWLIITHVGSWIYFAIGLNAAHHHPDIFHDGDDPLEDSDWGLHILNSLMDRVDVNGSHFKVLTSFGDHALHHFFPAMDHADLPQLYPILHKTCEEFKTGLRFTTQIDLILGQYKQVARNIPKKRS